MDTGQRSGLARITGSARNEDGFTLIELLIVLAIIGILLAIAIPAYLGFENGAADKTAKANIRAAMPAIEAYFSDTGTYSGMSIAALKAGYDSGIAPGVSLYGNPTATAYCLASTQGGRTWSVLGPGIGSGAYRANGTCA